MTNTERPRQRGVALLTVLLVAALASVLAVSMITRQHLSIAKTRQVVHGQQALEYALGAETWVRGLLRADLEEDESVPPVDSLADRWAQTEAPMEIDNGALQIRVRDLGGRLNLNAVNDAAGVDRLGRLLSALGLDPLLAERVRDWTDEDQEVAGSGAEDGRYLLEAPSYRTANAPFASVTELRLLAELDEEAYLRLLPHVAALPPAVRRINVNTATGAVLAALAPGMDAQRMAAYTQPEAPWSTPQELIAREVGFAPEAGVLATRSDWFEVLVRADYGSQSVTLRSIVHRDPETGRTHVVGRDLGQHFDSWADGGADRDDGDDAPALPDLEAP
ncbi:MAG TPA: type II secretion system minor pseudopilin GspK [Pseudomonadales bacterium]|nr:type II secretion system minor pseudopilin GspK [Pseudomonadales bacterium]